MNVAHFVEKTGGHGSLPPSSEGFWIAVFAFFVLHLARHCAPAADLNLGLTVPLPCGSELRRHGAVSHEVFA